MKYLVFIAATVLFFSCDRGSKVVNSPTKSSTPDDQGFKIIRVDKLLFETDTSKLNDALALFHAQNKEYTDIYTGNILRVGLVGEAQTIPALKGFVTDTVFSKVAATVLEKFNDISKTEKLIDKGLKKYRQNFPTAAIPKIYAHISGFNQPVFSSDQAIGIGLEMYLGRDCVFYDYLGIPQYKINNMYPEKMVTDLFYTMAFAQFANVDSTDNLLSNMIYQGKLLYFAEMMCPDLHDSVNIGYTSKQLKWCKKNETQMWTYLIENKILYSTERMVLQKFIADSPATNTFSPDSPGRTGAWIGLQIVRSFMENNETVTLPELMKIGSAQQLLSQSKYFP